MLVLAVFSIASSMQGAQPPAAAAEEAQGSSVNVNKIYKACVLAYGDKNEKQKELRFPGLAIVKNEQDTSQQMSTLRHKIKELKSIYSRYFNGLGRDDNAKYLMCLYWLSQALCHLTIDTSKWEKYKDPQEFEIKPEEAVAVTFPATALQTVAPAPPTTATVASTTISESASSPEVELAKSQSALPKSEKIQKDFSHFVQQSREYISILNSIGTYLEAVRDLRNFATLKEIEQLKDESLKGLLRFMREMETYNISPTNLFPLNSATKFSLQSNEFKFGFKVDYLQHLFARENKLSGLLSEVESDFKDKQTTRIRDIARALGWKQVGKDDILPSRLPGKDKSKADTSKPESAKSESAPNKYQSDGAVIFEKYGYWPQMQYPHSSVSYIRKINKEDADEVWSQVIGVSEFKAPEDLYETKALLMKYIYFIHTYKIVKFEKPAQPNFFGNMFALAKQYFELAQKAFNSPTSSPSISEPGLNMINAAESACLLYEVLAILKYLNVTVDGNDENTLKALDLFYKGLFGKDGALNDFKSKFSNLQLSKDPGQSVTLKNLDYEYYKCFMQVIEPLCKDLSAQRFYATHSKDAVLQQVQWVGDGGKVVVGWVATAAKFTAEQITKTSLFQKLRGKVGSATQAVSGSAKKGYAQATEYAKTKYEQVKSSVATSADQVRQNVEATAAQLAASPKLKPFVEGARTFWKTFNEPTAAPTPPTTETTPVTTPASTAATAETPAATTTSVATTPEQTAATPTVPEATPTQAAITAVPEMKGKEETETAVPVVLSAPTTEITPVTTPASTEVTTTPPATTETAVAETAAQAATTTTTPEAKPAEAATTAVIEKKEDGK